MKIETGKKQLGWLDKNEMAVSLGITRQTFDRWGVVPLAKKGRTTWYDVRSVVENRLTHAQTKANAITNKEEGIDYEKYRLTRAQADGQELKNELARGEVAPVELQSRVLSKCMAEAGGILDTLILTIARKHPELSTMQKENIKREVVKAQNAIANGHKLITQFLDEYIEKAT
ncbi:MAG: terminase small subunit [Flavobacteriales bacterium]